MAEEKVKKSSVFIPEKLRLQARRIEEQKNLSLQKLLIRGLELAIAEAKDEKKAGK